MLPDKPLEFMNTYALFLDSFGESGLKWAKLTGGTVSEGLATTYTLTCVGGPGEGHFRIYWCQYSKDKVFSVTLANEADLMFTPKMTGCTFAVGTRASDGTIIVGHANVYDSLNDELKSLEEEMYNPKTSTERQTQLNGIRLALIQKRQLEMLSGELGEKKVDVKIKLDTTNPNYTSSTGGIITFGVRDTEASKHKWKFYFQTKNSANRVTGVHKLSK